jgi:hypothetical protein
MLSSETGKEKCDFRRLGVACSTNHSTGYSILELIRTPCESGNAGHIRVGERALGRLESRGFGAKFADGLQGEIIGFLNAFQIG